MAENALDTDWHWHEGHMIEGEQHEGHWIGPESVPVVVEAVVLPRPPGIFQREGAGPVRPGPNTALTRG
jgi:hypothetical protein